MLLLELLLLLLLLLLLQRRPSCSSSPSRCSEAGGPPRGRRRPQVPGAVSEEAPVGVAAGAHGEPGAAELGLRERERERGFFFRR